MKRAILITFLVLALSASYVQAQMGRGMMGGGQQQSSSEQAQQPYPYQMSPGMMGPGMMGGGMMGRGMMGGGMGMMGPGMMGPGMMGYGMGSGGGYGDPEKYNKFLDDTVDLRKKIQDKTFEYYEAMRNPKTTMGSLAKKEKEINELQQKLYEKAQKYQQ